MHGCTEKSHASQAIIYSTSAQHVMKNTDVSDTMLTLNHRSPRAPDAVAEQPQNNWLFTVDLSGYLISPVWLRCTTSMHALTSTRLHIFIHIHVVINCCPPPVVQILGLIHFYLWLSKHSPLIPLPQYRGEELIDWMIIPPPYNPLVL